MRGKATLDAALEQHGRALALALIGLAFAVRLPGLFGWWLNPDEGTYFAVVTQTDITTALAEGAATAHPPLYFLILRALAVAGTDFAWLRAPALVCGCAAVYVFVLVGRELGGPGGRGWLAGLTSGLLLALSPRAIVLSQVIRPYMLLVLLLASGLYALLRYLQRPAHGALLGYAVSTTLAMLLHYGAALGLGVLGLLVLMDGAQRGVSRPEWRRLLLVHALPGGTLASLWVWQLRDLAAGPVAEFALQGWLADYMIRSPGDVWLRLVGFHSMLVGDALAVAATAASAVGLVWAVRARAWPLLVVGASAPALATALAALELYPFGGGRHSTWLLAFVTPGLGCLAAALASAGRRVRVGATAALVLLAAGTAPASSALGARLTTSDASEHVLRTAGVRALAEPLDPTRAPRVVVMSLETYRLLVPLYAAERQGAGSSPDGLYAHFRWGDRDVLVLPGLDVAARPEEAGQPNHLLTATRRAAAGFGVVLPPPGEPVLVLSGGWHVRGVFDLAELSGAAGLGGTTESVPGLIAITLDLDAYGRALEALGAGGGS